MSALEQHDNAITRIQEIENLPPFPLLSNILKAFIAAEDNGDIRPLISNVKSEPNIVAKVIGVANSAFYGLHSPVRSIKDAIIRLGVVKLKSIVFSIILTSRFDVNKCPLFNIGRFWEESMLLALCASLLADRCENFRFNRDEVYSISLISKIGLLALIHLDPGKMRTVLESKGEEELVLREQQILHGIDHYQAGGLLQKQWRLPREYWLTTLHLNDKAYSGENSEFVNLLKRAKELVASDFVCENSYIDRLLGLNSSDFMNIADTFENGKSWIQTFAKCF